MKLVITMHVHDDLKPLTRSHLAALIGNVNNKYELEEVE